MLVCLANSKTVGRRWSMTSENYTIIRSTVYGGLKSGSLSITHSNNNSNNKSREWKITEYKTTKNVDARRGYDGCLSIQRILLLCLHCIISLSLNCLSFFGCFVLYCIYFCWIVNEGYDRMNVIYLLKRWNREIIKAKNLLLWRNFFLFGWVCLFNEGFDAGKTQ